MYIYKFTKEEKITIPNVYTRKLPLKRHSNNIKQEERPPPHTNRKDRRKNEHFPRRKKNK